MTGDPNPEPPPQTEMTTVWRWELRRGFLLRRRKVMIVRLGGKKPRLRMAGLVSVLRRMKERVKCIRMMRKAKELCRKLVRDMAKAGATMEQIQQRLFMDTTFAIPVAAPFSYPYPYPSHFPSNRFL